MKWFNTLFNLQSLFYDNCRKKTYFSVLPLYSGNPVLINESLSNKILQVLRQGDKGTCVI